MVLPNSNDLEAKTPKENSDHDSRIETLKSSLRLAYKLVKKANKKSHLKNGYMTGKQNQGAFKQMT